MSRETNQPRNRARNAVLEYIAALEEIYPIAKGKTRILARQDNRVIVSIPLPKLTRERMRIFDRMAEVGTKILLETDECIILSGQ
jgi:hypothetical protein